MYKVASVQIQDDGIHPIQPTRFIYMPLAYINSVCMFRGIFLMRRYCPNFDCSLPNTPYRQNVEVNLRARMTPGSMPIEYSMKVK
jgi:hypothetical protein